LAFQYLAGKIDVHVYPESNIPLLVDIATARSWRKLGIRNMSTPIANGFGWPERSDAGEHRNCLLLADFLERPEITERFPCFRLDRRSA